MGTKVDPHKLPWLSKERYAALYRVFKAVESGEVNPIAAVSQWSTREYGANGVDQNQLTEDLALYVLLLLNALAATEWPAVILGYVPLRQYREQLRERAAQLSADVAALQEARDKAQSEHNQIWRERWKLQEELNATRIQVKSLKTQLANQKALLEQLAPMLDTVRSIAEGAGSITREAANGPQEKQ